jgi:methionyl-tRNA formyltransferase
MRVIFMGSPDFAVPALQALHAAGHEIVCVYSQPPRPAGRGQKLTNTAVHDAALQLGLVVRTPASLKPAEEVEAFQTLNADVAVVAAYGLILRQNVLDAPKFGCINIHGSILPRWRGAAPVQRAIQSGDTETGVTIMQMDKGLDTGPMLMLETLPIGPTDTTQTVMDAMAALGARMIVAALDKVQANELHPQAQPADGVEYAHKIDKSESVIDWTQSAAQIDRTLRAFTPWPGIWTMIQGERIRLWQVEITDETEVAQPGTVIDAPLTIACGSGALRVKTLQRPGKPAQDVVEFLKSFPIAVGTQCTTPDIA